MITEPLHVAIVDDRQLRFFRSPNNDGRPDFPWHSTDDLQSVFGLNRAQCRIMTTMWWNGPYVPLDFLRHALMRDHRGRPSGPHGIVLHQLAAEADAPVISS